MLILSIKIWYFQRIPSILLNKTLKIVLIFFKTNPNVCITSLFEHAFAIKIKEIEMAFTLSNRQLRKMATSKILVAKFSFKIRKYNICILPKCFFEGWNEK